MREGGSMRGLRRVGVVLCVVGLAGKRQFVVLAILASALLMAIPAAAAADSLEASFQEFGGRAIAHPCDAFSCGTGEVEGFGSATSSFEVLSFDFDPVTRCGAVTSQYTITLSSAPGTLVLAESGAACFPGNSHFGAEAHSYGNPFTLTTSWTVASGTGLFAGASGSGTGVMKSGGDSAHSVLSGSITLG